MKVIIMVIGGLVQEVICDGQLDYLIIDQDVQDEDETCALLDTANQPFKAALTEYSTSPAPAVIEHYWNQIPPL